MNVSANFFERTLERRSVFFQTIVKKWLPKADLLRIEIVKSQPSREMVEAMARAKNNDLQLSQTRSKISQFGVNFFSHLGKIFPFNSDKEFKSLV